MNKIQNKLINIKEDINLILFENNLFNLNEMKIFNSICEDIIKNV